MPAGVPASTQSTMDKSHSEAIILREGDLLKVTFPGSPNLDTTQPIRRDGKLNLPLIGEVEASGLSPARVVAGSVHFDCRLFVSGQFWRLPG